MHKLNKTKKPISTFTNKKFTITTTNQHFKFSFITNDNQIIKTMNLNSLQIDPFIVIGTNVAS
jgi:hypothetical protein